MRLSFLLILQCCLLLTLPARAKQLVEPLPAVSYVVPGYADIDSLRMRLAAMPLHAVEGLWQFPSDGAVVAIVRSDAERESDVHIASAYRMMVVRSPRRSVRPGTLMGHLSRTSKPGVYAAQIYTSGDGGSRLAVARKFTVTQSDDGHLSFSRSRLWVRANIWRLFPYLSRVSLRVGRTHDEPRDLDGLIRLFPAPVSGPIEPVYL